MIRKSEHMFEKVNITSLTATTLLFLARSPNKQYYLRELSRITGGSVGGTHKVLQTLVKWDFIRKKARGKNTYYQVTDHPAIRYIKIFWSIKELDDIISTIKPKSVRIFLFGSCSTGEDTIESDIDILIAAKEKGTLSRQLQNTFINGRKLKPIIKTPSEFLKLKTRDRNFYNEISKGIEIWREIDEEL